VCVHHDWRAEFRVTEHNDRARPHLEAKFLGGSRVIDLGKTMKPSDSFLSPPLEGANGSLHRITTRSVISPLSAASVVFANANNASESAKPVTVCLIVVMDPSRYFGIDVQE
jgi:hypothetical protein